MDCPVRGNEGKEGIPMSRFTHYGHFSRNENSGEAGTQRDSWTPATLLCLTAT